MRQESAEMLHPDVVADDFKVHRRTVFRWVESGYLTSKNGRVPKAEIEESRANLGISCTQKEARKKLGDVSQGTLRNWIRKGILQEVFCFSKRRILKESIARALELKTGKGKRINAYPHHVHKNALLPVTGLENSVLRSFIKRGEIRSEVVEGRTMIPLDEYNRIKDLMESTVRPIDAQRFLQKTRSEVEKLRESGEVREVTVLGRVRIAIDSIAKTEEEKGRLRKFLRSKRNSSDSTSRLPSLVNAFSNQLTRLGVSYRRV
jgi:hypothetical protein